MSPVATRISGADSGNGLSAAGVVGVGTSVLDRLAATIAAALGDTGVPLPQAHVPETSADRQRMTMGALEDVRTMEARLYNGRAFGRYAPK